MVVSFNDPDTPLLDFSKKKSVNQFYIFSHVGLGCENPKCRYVHDEYEIKSKKIQNYIKNHKYFGGETEVYQFESKLWKLDEVLQLESVGGWTPSYIFCENGFTYVGSIDLVEHEKHISENGKISIKPSCCFNLEEKREHIKVELEKLDYKNKKMILYRTSRGYPAVWDCIDFFAEGNQSETKYSHRRKINKRLVKQKLESYIKEPLKIINLIRRIENG